MLAIRMQRTGRSGHANFRVIVQDSRQAPTSGKVVATLGSYDPHTKQATLTKDKASFYLEHGAQPSDRVARLFKQEGIKLPKWVSVSGDKAGKLRNPEKLRKNRPASTDQTTETVVKTEAAEEKSADAPEPESAKEETVAEAPKVEDAPSEEVASEEIPADAEPGAETDKAA